MNRQAGLLRNILSRMVFWLYCARYHSWMQSFMPAFLTVILVAGEPDFKPTAAIMAILGVVLAHLSANLLDDYFDYRCGSVESRRKMIDGGLRARGRKCSYLTENKTTLTRLLLVGLLLGTLASTFGVFLCWYRGVSVAWCFLAGAILAFFYSAPPLRLSFHGLGELSVGLLFGPLLMAGVSCSACGHLSIPVLVISCPIGLLVANVLYTHSILDLGPDRRAGKKTFAVLMGRESRAVAVLGILLLLVYLPVFVAIYFGLLSKFQLMTALSIPLAIVLFRFMRIYFRDPNRVISPAFWMGPTEHWSAMCAAGIDWFMIRWYLARNLLTAFCLLVGLASVLERLWS